MEVVKFYIIPLVCILTFNIFGDNDDILDNPPKCKIIAYEAAKKGLLPNIYYQPKNQILDHFFFGTTIGVDVSRFKIKKNIELGVAGIRFDILNSLLDFILIKTKSDVTRFKYGGIFDDHKCLDLFKSCIATNFVIPLFFLKLYFLRITFVEVNIGQLIYLVKVVFSTDIINNETRYEKVKKFAKANVIASTFIPSFQIDLSALIDLCKNKKEDVESISLPENEDIEKNK